MNKSALKGDFLTHTRSKKGVTLLALVITIIVLLILAGITISLTVGEDGIISQAQQAAQETKIAEIKDKIKLDILAAETDAIIRGENLEQAQLNDIIEKYGELQEDEDTIITHEDKFKISLKEIWYGVLSDSGSYTDKLEQIEILEKELADLKEQYKNLEDLNSGNSEVLGDLQNKIATLESEKSAIEDEYRNYREIIVAAIKEAGGEQLDVDEVATKVAESIKNIVADVTKDATATAEDIATGKTAYVKGDLVTGTSSLSSNTEDLSIGFYCNIYSGSSGYNQASANGRFIFDCSNYSSYEITGISYKRSNNATGQTESTSAESEMNLRVYDGDTNAQLSAHGSLWGSLSENLNVRYDITNVSKIRLDVNSGGHNAGTTKNYTVQGTIVFHK